MVVVPAAIAYGRPNPVAFSGTISTNGAADIRYQWEITGDKTNIAGDVELYTGGQTAHVGSRGLQCGLQQR